jgi:hypothetical protein
LQYVAVFVVQVPAPLQYSAAMTLAAPEHEDAAHCTVFPGTDPHEVDVPLHCAWHEPVPVHATREGSDPT